MIIDAHNHLGGPDSVDGRSQSAEELLARMAEAGIDMSVVFPFNTPGEDGTFREANDIVAEAARAHPNRLIGFGRVNPNLGETALMEAERCFIEHGMRGLKLHPKVQNFAIGHPIVRELMLLVAGYQGVVVFDTGTKIAPWSALSDLASRFPHVSIIGAHMRGDGFMEAAELAPNLYLGTTDVTNTERIEEAIRLLGSRQVISGSDSPYINPEKERRKIDSLNISEKDKELIAGGNIQRLLKL